MLYPRWLIDLRWPLHAAFILWHGVCRMVGALQVNFWHCWFGQSKRWGTKAGGFLIMITKAIDGLGTEYMAKVGVPFIELGLE